MNSYKKRSLISILTMVMVTGLLSTAQAVNTDSSSRLVRNGDGNNNNRVDHARTGRGGNKTVKVPTFTSETDAQTVSTANTKGNNRRLNINNYHGDGNKTVKVPASTSETATQAVSSVNTKGNNRRLNINNHHGDGNNDNRGEHARTGRGGCKTVKVPTSTNVTAALTVSPVRP